MSYRERLAEAVQSRRVAQGWTQADVAKRGGPSTETLRLIEGSRRPDYGASTVNRLDRALGWRAATSAALLHRELSDEDEERVHTWIVGGADPTQLDVRALLPAGAVQDSARAEDTVDAQVVRAEGIPSGEQVGRPQVHQLGPAGERSGARQLASVAQLVEAAVDGDSVTLTLTNVDKTTREAFRRAAEQVDPPLFDEMSRLVKRLTQGVATPAVQEAVEAIARAMPDVLAHEMQVRRPHDEQ